MQIQPAKHAPIDIEKWREIIDSWSKSGENQKAYCERHGLSLNTFCYVRGKLLKQAKPKNKFVPLTIKSTSQCLSPATVVILENSRGYKLHIPTSLSLDQLTNLFRLSGWLNA